MHLSEIRDLERLMMRIETGYASPRDIAGLRYSLEHIAPLSQLLSSFSETALAQAKDKLSDVTGIVKKIRDALVDAPPLRISDGGIFRTGFNAELDELKTLANGQPCLDCPLSSSSERSISDQNLKSRLYQGIRLLHRSEPRTSRQDPRQFPKTANTRQWRKVHHTRT